MQIRGSLGITKDSDGIFITINGEKYAKCNFLGDFMVLKEFKEGEEIKLDPDFLDAIDGNRYLIIKHNGESMAIKIKEIEKELNIKKFRKIKITLDNKENKI